MSPDVPASIRARLLAKAQRRGEEFELFLVRYAIERFLYRLGASPLRERCVVKGAALLTLWLKDPYRATRDLDLLAFGPHDDAAIRSIVETVAAVPCPEDGLVFETGKLRISSIREADPYGGHRAVLLARLGTARIRVQVDFGLGDAVVPPPEDRLYPTLLDDLPAPSIRAYPLVVSIAEKFETMVTLGRTSSRMKDFHDVAVMATTFPFDGSDLLRAVSACFTRRGTPWTTETPEALGSEFYQVDALQRRWAAYVGAGSTQGDVSTSFENVGKMIRAFLVPVHDAAIAARAFKARWSPGGPWR
jgi:hypothetical protein